MKTNPLALENFFCLATFSLSPASPSIVQGAKKQKLSFFVGSDLLFFCFWILIFFKGLSADSAPIAALALQSVSSLCRFFFFCFFAPLGPNLLLVIFFMIKQTKNRRSVFYFYQFELHHFRGWHDPTACAPHPFLFYLLIFFKTGELLYICCCG